MINFNCINASFMVAYQSLEDVHVMIVKLGSKRSMPRAFDYADRQLGEASISIENAIDVDTLLRPS